MSYWVKTDGRVAFEGMIGKPQLVSENSCAATVLRRQMCHLYVCH